MKTKEKYIPPYKVSGKAMNLIAEIAAGECGPFIDFMLDKILRTLKAKGQAYEIAAAETDKKTNKKTIEKTNKKTDQKILSIMKSMPDVTLAELANATGLSVAGNAFGDTEGGY